MSNIRFMMSIIMYFIRLDVFRLEQNWFDFENKVFATCGVRHRKPGSGAVNSRSYTTFIMADGARDW